MLIYIGEPENPLEPGIHLRISYKNPDSAKGSGSKECFSSISFVSPGMGRNLSDSDNSDNWAFLISLICA